MASPTITFQVDLTPMTGELIGTSSDSTNQAVLSPDRYQTSNDRARAQMADRPRLREIYLPGVNGAMNLGKNLQQGSQFTVSGSQAYYLLHAYGQGYATDNSMAILKVISMAN